MLNILQERELKTQIQILIDYLRNDPLFQGKNVEGTNLYKVVSSFATEFLSFRDKVNLVYSEYNPETTTDYLEEWETMLNLPDDCFDVTGSNELRRQQIMARFASINASTERDFVAIAAVFGVDITVVPGVEAAGLPVTLPFTLVDSENAAFVMLIEFNSTTAGSVLPATLPFTLGPDINARLICLFEKLKSADVEIIFQFT